MITNVNKNIINMVEKLLLKFTSAIVKFPDFPASSSVFALI